MCRSEAEWYEPSEEKKYVLTDQDIKTAFPHCPLIDGIVHIKPFKIFGIKVLDISRETGFFVTVTPNTPYYLSGTPNHTISKKIGRYNTNISIEWDSAETCISDLIRTVSSDYATALVGPDRYALDEEEIKKATEVILANAHRIHDKN